MLGRLGKVTLLLATLGAVLAAATPALGAPQVAGEFAIPGGSEISSDNEIVAGPDGNMWVTVSAPNGVARFTPEGVGTFFPLAATPFGITVGPDGNLWASQGIGVAKIPPSNPALAEEVPIGGGYANGRGITVGPDGNIWIVGSNSLTRINPASPSVGQDVNVITTANAKGMTTASDGLLWYADSDKVVSATATDTPTLTPYTVGGGTQDVAAGPGAQVAYVNPGGDPQTVGLLSPGGAPQLVPAPASDPFGAVFGQDGAYWIARSNTNDLLRVTPDGQSSSLTGFAPSGGVGPRKIATGPGGTLWVTLDTPDKVAKVTGVDPPLPDPSEPDTTIDKGPKKNVDAKRTKTRVKFRFSSDAAGATFECALEKRKAKSFTFRACKSPKKYRLKRGRYTFEVRAVAGALSDPSPAIRKFRIK